MLDDDWTPPLRTRMATLCPGYIFNYVQLQDDLFARLQDYSIEKKVMVLRSICNGWATSYRYHETVRLPCLFGCKLLHPVDQRKRGQRDDMVHYLGCPFLWKLVETLTGEYFCFISDRLGVGRHDGVEGIILAHHLYHFLKMGRKQEATQVTSWRQLALVHDSVLRFGRAILLEG